MPASLQITLREDLAQLVHDKVASGSYASESDVISASLEAMKAQDASVDRWLKDDVLPTLDRVERGEETLLSIGDVFEGVEARYKARKAQSHR